MRHSMSKLIVRCLTGVLIALLPFGASAHDGEPSSGEVALADWPYCNTLAIRTSSGFSIAEWQDGLWLYDRGDAVVGALDHTGRHTLWIDNAVRSGEMSVLIDAVGLTWLRAQERFVDTCAIHGWRHSAALQAGDEAGSPLTTLGQP